jgi:hypothetical protein
LPRYRCATTATALSYRRENAVAIRSATGLQPL